jgi:hypothetical protein
MQIILNTFFKADETEHFLSRTGEWMIKIFVGDSRQQILSKRFLIMPNELTDNILSNIDQLSIQLFWNFEAICLNSFENLQEKTSILLDRVLPRCEKIHWSTFYPDPKSDLSEFNLKVDKLHRIMP